MCSLQGWFRLEGKLAALGVGDKPCYLASVSEQEPTIVRSTEFAELSALVAVAQERSFRRAAVKLNLTPSTLSHSLRSLEERLGVRLLVRTTRTVAPTEAGQALLDQIAPAFASIVAAVEGVNEFRDRPHGVVRLNVPMTAAITLLTPIFGAFARELPDVTLEVTVNEGFVDIIKGGFDAGIRIGEDLEQDMTAVRLTRDFRTAVVASPAYFEQRALPQSPYDLHAHRCIGYRLHGSGALFRWEFTRDGKQLTVAVAGPLILDSHELIIAAALDGVGLACVLEEAVADHLANGRLVRVLDEWCEPYPGFHLYYPMHRQGSRSLKALVDMLRARAG
jgi:DNA-binding transcriptional LysR family regulator